MRNVSKLNVNALTVTTVLSGCKMNMKRCLLFVDKMRWKVWWLFPTYINLSMVENLLTRSTTSQRINCWVEVSEEIATKKNPLNFGWMSSFSTVFFFSASCCFFAMSRLESASCEEDNINELLNYLLRFIYCTLNSSHIYLQRFHFISFSEAVLHEYTVKIFS